MFRSSDNTNTLKARPGDLVTLTFTASEPISTPTVTFASGATTVNGNVTVQNINDTWTADLTPKANISQVL